MWFFRSEKRPKILLLADRRGWAYDSCARMLRRCLGDRFAFDLRYVAENPRLELQRYDLVYIYFWGEDYHRRFPLEGVRIVKEVSSHRWEDDPLYGPCTPAELCERHIFDATAVICTSRRLCDLVRPVRKQVYYAANGYDEERFRAGRARSGELVLGWAGNAQDPVKRFAELIEPAASGYPFRAATGRLPRARMNGFYHGVDVSIVASRHEGTPLPLLESMAAGCFPVCVNVGVVPEIVTSGENGLIVEATVDAFREAFAWCRSNLPKVRAAGAANAVRIRERGWITASLRFGEILDTVLSLEPE